MPPPLVVDLSKVDLSKVAYPLEEIHKSNPQRFEFDQLSGIHHLDLEAGEVVGYRQIGQDEFWMRGHIPGRPLFPGVLMVEGSAQLASFWIKRKLGPEDPRFIGFGGIEGVRFRATVGPGERIVYLGKCLEYRPRRAMFATQGLVGDKLVYEGTIIGMAV